MRMCECLLDLTSTEVVVFTSSLMKQGDFAVGHQYVELVLKLIKISNVCVIVKELKFKY